MPTPEPTLEEILKPLWKLILHLSPSEAVLIILCVSPFLLAIYTFFAQIRSYNLVEDESSGDDAEAGAGGMNEQTIAGLARDIASLRAELQSLRATSSCFSSSSYVGVESSAVQIALPEPPTPPPRTSSPQQPRPCFCAAGPAFPSATAPTVAAASSSDAPRSAVSTAPRLSAGGSPVEALSVGGARYWRSPSTEAAADASSPRRDGSGSEV